MVMTLFDPVLLRSFVAVVDCGNFTRAAERLHLTQSTVSQQIRRLEDAVACQLLDRDQRRNHQNILLLGSPDLTFTPLEDADASTR